MAVKFANGKTKTQKDREAGTWRRLNGRSEGTFFKFTDEGDELTGKWQGMSEGKGRFGGMNGTIANSEGVHVFGISAGLRDLDEVDEGSEVRLVYKGYPEGKRYKAFDIYVR